MQWGPVYRECPTAGPVVATICIALFLGACGSGGANTPAEAASRTISPVGNSTTWLPGTFMPAATYKNQCATPRTGVNPATGQLFADVGGSVAAENFWLRSWSRETYLWYRELADLDPAQYTTSDYFNRLKTSALTPSGNPKDQFHFTYPTIDWLALSQSGVQASYGVQWSIIASTAPRRIVAAYVEPNSPAAIQGVARGDEVIAIDGHDIVTGTSQATIDALNAGISPKLTDVSHTFTLRTTAQLQYTITMQSANVTSTPVLVTSIIEPPPANPALGRAGYLVFNDHIATAEAQLVSAVQLFRTAGVTDLILDLRYNGGGFLSLASELAYMIAGPGPTAGKTFEQLVFNDQHPTTNPVTGATLTPIPFFDDTGYSNPGQPLPTLGLSRVFVITGSGTCSASESIINSLRGVDVEVIQIGTTTCGKPYGFYPTDNCGTTYFTIQFKGVNAKGYGDYTDGFTPSNAVAGLIGERVSGCSVSDDFSRPLGDPAEARLAAALNWRNSPGTCPTAPVTNPVGLTKPSVAILDGDLARSPAREARILEER